MKIIAVLFLLLSGSVSFSFNDEAEKELEVIRTLSIACQEGYTTAKEAYGNSVKYKAGSEKAECLTVAINTAYQGKFAVENVCNAFQDSADAVDACKKMADDL